MSSIDIPFTSPILVLDPHVCGELIEQRKERLAYRKDEVWEGTYVMSPDPNNEHQFYVGRLTSIFDQIVKPMGGIVYPGANVTDRETDWTSIIDLPMSSLCCQARRPGTLDPPFSAALIFWWKLFRPTTKQERSWPSIPKSACANC